METILAECIINYRTKKALNMYEYVG